MCDQSVYVAYVCGPNVCLCMCVFVCGLSVCVVRECVWSKYVCVCSLSVCMYVCALSVCVVKLYVCVA